MSLYPYRVCYRGGSAGRAPLATLHAGERPALRATLLDPRNRSEMWQSGDVATRASVT